MTRCRLFFLVGGGNQIPRISPQSQEKGLTQEKTRDDSIHLNPKRRTSYYQNARSIIMVDAMTAAGDDVQDRASQLYQGELLAPMVRASTTPLRTLALRYGAHAVYTEELVDRSITATQRIENRSLGTIDYVRDVSNASAKTLRRLEREGGPPLLLRIDPQVEGGKLICQMGSGEPALALAAALHIHRDVDSLDLNMGCPKKFSVSGGMGSALLADPDRACNILRAWKDHLPEKPISAKIRLLSNNTGNKHSNDSAVSVSRTLDFISGLVERGRIHALAIHGRTVGHDAVIPADWTALEEVVIQTKTKYPNLSVLINGDFYTRAEFVKFQQRTGSNGVLLGRPALYNTSLFRRPSSSEESASQQDNNFGYNSPLLLNKTRVIQDYVHEAVRYDIHYKNVKYVICEMMNNRRAPSPRVPFLPQEFLGLQTIAKVCSCQSLDEICRVWNLEHSSILTSLSSTSTSSVTTVVGASTTTSVDAAPQQQLESKAQQPSAPAGEHKYDDEFILQKMGSDASSSAATTDNATKVSASSFSFLPPNKRTRVS